MTVAWILKQKGRNVISALPGTPVEHAVRFSKSTTSVRLSSWTSSTGCKGSCRSATSCASWQPRDRCPERAGGRAHDAECGSLHREPQHRLAYGTDDNAPFPAHPRGRERRAGRHRLNRRRGEAQARDGRIRSRPNAPVYCGGLIIRTASGRTAAGEKDPSPRPLPQGEREQLYWWMGSPLSLRGRVAQSGRVRGKPGVAG